ncbi:MAG: hypothetical protein ACM3IL_00660 [Deltaproteobacteria bacterium]
MKTRIPMRIWNVVLPALFIHNAALAVEISSNSHRVDIPAFLNGGGHTSSAFTEANFSAIGENGIYPLELSSTTYLLRSGQAYLLILTRSELPSALIISDLRAYTEPMGLPIAEKTWQRDADPYFTWHIDREPRNLLRGFSVSLDTLPDQVIDTASADYRFGENSIPSGKHNFYVLPFTSDKGPEEASRLSFEIWVDKDAPYVNQASPPSGQIVSDILTPISCVVYDNDSGLDLSRTALNLNNGSVAYDYDVKTQTLKSRSGTSLSEGKNTVMIKAYDQVGNYVTRAWDFVVDTNPPYGKIMINGGQAVTHSAYVSIDIEAQDAVSQIKDIYLSNDGVFDTELNQPFGYQPVISGWLLGQPDTDGQKMVYAKFRDFAGNLSQAVQASIALKRLTPDTRIISGPPSITEKTDADFRYEASKPGCKFSYKLDNLAWSDWSDAGEAHFTGLTTGNHYLYVKSGYDLNGDNKITIDEEDATPDQWVWSVKPEGYLEKLRKRILFWRR